MTAQRKAIVQATRHGWQYVTEYGGAVVMDRLDCATRIAVINGRIVLWNRKPLTEDML